MSPQVRVRLYTSPALLKHTWPLLSSQQPLSKESEWACIPAELLASSDLSYCINTDHTLSEQTEQKRTQSECSRPFKPKRESSSRVLFFSWLTLIDKVSPKWFALLDLCQSHGGNAKRSRWVRGRSLSFESTDMKLVKKKRQKRDRN